MCPCPNNDVDRFNRLLELSGQGVLSQEEESPLAEVRRAAARWGALGNAYQFLLAATSARIAGRYDPSFTPARFKFRSWWYFSAAERAKIDAIVASHERENSRAQSAHGNHFFSSMP